MNGKITLNLAISLDGYIADEDGGYDWIVGDGSSDLDTESRWEHSKFLENIDVVVMGRKCYDQDFHKDYPTKEVYIATSEKMEDYENFRFINEDIVSTILGLKKQGKNIFLFGGGILADAFLKTDSIDEFVIGFIPTILGKGRKLFLENNPKIDLKLEYYSIESGIAVMRYSKR